jgi:glycosyltransferase involved in cell wall biosynthesis
MIGEGPVLELTPAARIVGEPLPGPAVPRVLMLHTTLPSAGRKPGGVEIAVHRLANALVDLGVPVTVASLNEAPKDARYSHRRLFPRLPWLRDSRVGRLLALPALLNGIRLGDADVVHYHGDDWFVLRRPRATVRTLHGSALREAQWATRWQRKLVQYLIFPLERLAAMLATVSVAVGEDAASLHHTRHVVGNGVDPALFTPGGKSAVPTILYVGTWEGRKRGGWMYELFTEYIAPRHPDVELRFIADRAPPPHPRVHYERFPDDRALAQSYREAWVFALPSTYEGFGIPYLEAMSSGTAVLATPNTGASELLGNGRFGVLADDAIFGDALLRLLHDPDMRARIEAAGLERARAFAWQEVAHAYLDLYHHALRKRHGLRVAPSAGTNASDGVRRELPTARPSAQRRRFGVARGFALVTKPTLAALGDTRLHKWLERLLDGAMTLVDVGAGDGSPIVVALARSQIRQLLAFEPDLARREMIPRVLALNGLATDPRLRLSGDMVQGSDGVGTTTLDALIPRVRWPLVVRVAAGASPAAMSSANALIAQDSTRWIVGVTPATRGDMRERFEQAGYVVRSVRTGLVSHAQHWLVAWHSSDSLGGR